MARWSKAKPFLSRSLGHLVKKIEGQVYNMAILLAQIPSGTRDLTFLCPQRNFGRHIVIALSVRSSVRPSRFRVRSISPIFFVIGIPNLVCGYILGWRSVAYHFRVTVTLALTSDLVFRIIVSGAYLLYYLR